MAFNFPDTPAIGDTYPNPALPGAPVYRWDGEKWTGPSGGAVAANVWTQDTAPPISAAKDGDLWWETDTGKLFVAYDDGTSLQWVSTQTPQGGWYVAKTGDTMTGALNGTSFNFSGGGGIGANLAVGGNASAGIQAVLNAAATTTRQLAFQTAGLARWTIGLTGAAESGSSAGADLGISNYDDSGANLGMPFSINRASGGATFSGVLHGDISLNKAASAGTACNIWGKRGASIPRWVMCLGDSTAEGGSNAGSNFIVQRYSDAGASLGAALTIFRSNGSATFSGVVTAATFSFGNSSIGNTAMELGTPGGNQNYYVDYHSGTTANDYDVRMTISGGSGATAVGNVSFECGSFYSTGLIRSNAGYGCRSGTAGPTQANLWNIDWSGGAHLWIDNVNQGVITTSSDYRVKKDVADLPSMWETAKGLRPISYTQADYTPPGAPQHKSEAGNAVPMFAADDKERWGFVAHELQEALIEDAATGVKDQPDLVQSPNPWTVIATLTKALQEAMARIEALEARA